MDNEKACPDIPLDRGAATLVRAEHDLDWISVHKTERDVIRLSSKSDWTDWCWCVSITDDDVAVLGPLSDHGVLATRRRRPGIVERHQGEVDTLSRLRHDHPRAGHGRTDPERPRRVAGDDTRLTAHHWVDTLIGLSEVSTVV